MAVPEEGLTLKETILKYVIAMIILSVSLFVFKTLNAIAFIFVTENIILGLRTNLYRSIMQKHMGWHDNRENSAGEMSTTLSSDV